MDHAILKFGTNSFIEKFRHAALDMANIKTPLLKRYEPQATLKKQIKLFEGKAEYIAHTESPEQSWLPAVADLKTVKVFISMIDSVVTASFFTKVLPHQLLVRVPLEQKGFKWFEVISEITRGNISHFYIALNTDD